MSLAGRGQAEVRSHRMNYGIGINDSDYVLCGGKKVRRADYIHTGSPRPVVRDDEQDWVAERISMAAD